MDLIDNQKELYNQININLKPNKKNKKELGEVFTPIELINEMLDKLPKEVWKNKNLRWLDPSTGTANFIIVIYYRLMESLKEIIINEKERKEHILQKMLYMCELNETNYNKVNQIFNTKINIKQQDYLKLDIKKEWNIDKFDIIIGNPPY